MHKPSLTSLCLSRVIGMMIALIMRTVRWKISGFDLLKQHQAQACMLCSWHGELALNAYCLRKKNIFCWLIVSQHKDGQLVANLLQRWGFPLIRGSTNAKGALNTTKTLLSLLKKPGTIVGITSDGPKGPIHQVKPGAIRMAQQCGANVLLMRAHASQCWRLNSWDQFIIPKPFSTVTIDISMAIVPDTKEGPKLAHAVSEQLTSACPVS
jgi:lysophospholipid acyltransferase (LPLAT)-like uncharacterized protein